MTSRPPNSKSSGPPRSSLPEQKQMGDNSTSIIIWYSITSIALTILLLLCIMIIVLIFKKSLKKSLSNKSGKFFFSLLITCLIFWVAEAIFGLINIIFIDNNMAENTETFMLLMPKLCYNTARLIMLFFFIFKSYVIFYSSNYRVNKLFVIILIILSIIAFILTSADMILNGLDKDQVIDLGENKRKRILRQYLLFGGWAVDLVVTICAMFKFIIILFKLTLNNTDYSNHKVKLNAIQLKMLKTITRNTVLATFALISSVIFGFFFNVYPVLNESVSGNDLNCAALTDSVANACCMFLSYSFATKLYNISCIYCDHGTEKCCIGITKLVIKQKSGKSVVKEKNITLGIPDKSKRYANELQSTTNTNTDTHLGAVNTSQHIQLSSTTFSEENEEL